MPTTQIMTLLDLQNISTRLLENPRLYADTPVKIYLGHDKNAEETMAVDVQNITTGIYASMDKKDKNGPVILIFPEKDLALKDSSDSTQLLTISQAAALAGGGMKEYVLKNLCQHSETNGFYPAIRLPGEGGRGRRVYIHRGLFVKWLEEQAGKEVKQEKRVS